MSTIKWFFMSKYNRLMYTLQVCKSNEQRLHLDNGMILNFENNTIEYEGGF